MLYLLGGAPRCGKSLLAREINRERGMAVVSTDLLRGVLAPLLPALKAAMDGGDVRAGFRYCTDLSDPKSYVQREVLALVW